MGFRSLKIFYLGLNLNYVLELVEDNWWVLVLVF